MTRTQVTDGGGSYVTLRKYEYNNEGRPGFFLGIIKTLWPDSTNCSGEAEYS